MLSVQLGSQTPFAGEVEIEVNDASNTAQLSSVPYAFHAQTVGQDNDTLKALSCASGQMAKWQSLGVC